MCEEYWFGYVTRFFVTGLKGGRVGWGGMGGRGRRKTERDGGPILGKFYNYFSHIRRIGG